MSIEFICNKFDILKIWIYKLAFCELRGSLSAAIEK